GLAREPELAAGGVVAEALARHRGDRRREQLLLRHHGQLVDEPGGIAPDEDDEGAEAGRPSPLEERESRRRVVGEERRRPRAERRGDRPLAARLDVEERKRDPLAFFCERAGRRRQALALGERPVEGAKPLLEQAHLLDEGGALGADALVEDPPWLLELVAE